MLKNGIDLSFLSPNSALRHSHSLNFNGVPAEENNEDQLFVDEDQIELENMMDNMLLNGGRDNANYNKSKSVVVKTIQNKQYQGAKTK